MVNVIHNDYYLDVLNVLEVHLNVVGVSADVFAAQYSVPLELKEAVATIIYAAPFMDNSSELVKLRGVLLNKFSKDEDLLKTTFVNQKVLRGLSHDMPDDALINFYMSTILDEHNTPTETPKAMPQAPGAVSTKNATFSPAASSAPVSAPKQPIALPQPNPDALSRLISSVTLAQQQMIGVLRRDNNGHFWAVPEDGTTPVFVPANNLQSSSESDTVLVQLDQRKDGKRSGKIWRNFSMELLNSAPVVPVMAAASSSGLSQSQAKLGMSAIAQQFFLRETQGVLKFDLKGNAWILDSPLDKPIFVPAFALGKGSHGDTVKVEVFLRDEKLIGKITSVLTSAPVHFGPSHISPQRESPTLIAPKHQQAVPQAKWHIKENDMLKALEVKAIPMYETVGLFKREDENFGVVLDATNAMQNPIIVLGDVHRGDASTGSRVRVVAFGHAINPANGSTVTLGQIMETLATKKSSNERNATLVSRDAAELVVTLEVNEDGDASILHPTLPWTYIVIPKEQLALAGARVGDEIAINLLDAKPQQGRIQGQFVGIVTAYGTKAHLEQEEPVEEEQGANVSMLESALASLNTFSEENAVEAKAKEETRFPIPLSINPNEVIVIDVGSFSIKTGYATQSVPIVCIPTLAGKVLPSVQLTASSSMPPTDWVVGNTAYERRALLNLTRILKGGRISDWSAMRSLLLGALTSINMDLRKATVLLIEAEQSHEENRKNYARLLFDDFKIPFVYFARASTSALLSERKNTGIIVDIGHTKTTITAINENNILSAFSISYPLSGADVTDRLASLLADDGYRMFQTEAQKLNVEDIKVNHAFVETNPKAFASDGSRSPTLHAFSQSRPVNYTLPDGSELVINQDHLWHCAEIFFRPSLIGKDIDGLPKVLYDVIQKVPREEMRENIFLVGGTSQMPGFRQRLQYELQLLARTPLYVDQPSYSQYSAWIGGAILARLPDFKSCLLSREEFLAIGPNAIDNTFV